MELFHSATVQVTDGNGLEIFHEVTSNRSLRVVARVVAAHLRTNGVKAMNLDKIEFNGLEAAFTHPAKKTFLTLKFPTELPENMVTELKNKFSEFITEISKFWEIRSFKNQYIHGATLNCDALHPTSSSEVPL